MTKNLKVLNISSNDLIGSRFNGYDWHEHLKNTGVDSFLMAQWSLQSQKSWVVPLSTFWASAEAKQAARTLRGLQLKIGSDHGPYPWSRDLFSSPEYLSADLVHFQIIMDGTLDVKTIERIISEKPVVWTFHDASPFTGHCVAPMKCDRWAKGCGECPDLARPFAIGLDRSKQNRAVKSGLMSLNFQAIVATRWMYSKLKQSGTRVPDEIKILPFGLDTSAFYPIELAPKNKIIIGIRSVPDTYKNFSLFLGCLEKVKNLSSFEFHVIGDPVELNLPGLTVKFFEWTSNLEELVNYYQKLDFFISPSQDESFGFMPLEAMACGAKIIGIVNSATAEICNLENFGIAISNSSSELLAEAIDGIAKKGHDASFASRMGRWNFVNQNYRIDDFIHDLVEIYKSTHRQFKNNE